MRLVVVSIFLSLIIGCSTKPEPNTLFHLKNNKSIGVDFVNNLEYTEELNTYTFRNFYNGGGVALGDINNDGLIDVFLSGNLVPNKLYLNQGNWIFKDISEHAGIECEGAWSMGVSMVDVDGDELLDIYICKSGPPGGPNRKNSLFINNGDLSFTDKATDYRVDNEGLSTHAAFFDYDKDGDLDFYLLNNSIRSVGGYDFRPDQRNARDLQGGNKFYRNDNSHFTEVGQEVGIYSSAIGFGLGVTVGDINGDDWPDMYISNDYFEKDYLYINNRDGTFIEKLEDYIRELSLSSMGADMGDLNNDGLPEIFVTDMLPSEESRLKTKTTFDNWDKYQLQLNNGYYRQHTRNTLQLNNGNGSFSEVSRYSKVEATDWSWGALIFDMDNDGLKDIFVANGIYKDLTDQDYVNFIGDPNFVRDILRRENKVITRLIDSIPSEPVPNCAFHNRTNMNFEEKAEEWGLGKPSFSNGSAYGDLDNDGDLDLVINNTNMSSFWYENQSNEVNEYHYLTFMLKGNERNTGAIGTKIYLYSDQEKFYQELMPMRSYQSTTDPRLHFGLGDISQIDSVQIKWPDGNLSLLRNVPIDTFITVDYQDIARTAAYYESREDYANRGSIFSESKEEVLDFVHEENDFVDFDRDRLIPHMLSNEGPCLCKGDVNGDGMDDLFIGGAKDQSGGLFIQKPGKKFERTNIQLFKKDALSEDTDCVFFDTDGDGDEDLYVTSGGNEFPPSSSALLDRLYINDGDDKFRKSDQLLPVPKYVSSSSVVPEDFDQDGDIDLFVGVRLNPFAYGTPTDSYLLENDGNGVFKSIGDQKAPSLKSIGMVTDAAWSDVDRDGDSDLIIVGEWMPLKILINQAGTFTLDGENGLDQSAGLWNCIKTEDIDNDGDQDFILGNHGLNSRLRASKKKPIEMFVNDFDQNGSIEQIISSYNQDKAYPMVLRHDLIMQLPGLKNRFLKYKDYSGKTIKEIFSKDQIDNSIISQVYNLQSSVLINDGSGNFNINALPWKAQLAPIYSIESGDFNRDGYVDLIMGGNFFRSKPEIGIYDATYSMLLAGNEKGAFTYVEPSESGVFIKGEVRQIIKLNMEDTKLLMFARNNQKVKILEY